MFVDEAQKVAPTGEDADLLFDLHNQDRIPVLLVCAGLSNCVERLADANLSRVDPNNIIRLGPLTPANSRAAAGRTLKKVRDELGISGDGNLIERLAERIADESDGWPMHIHNYLRGVWRTLLDHEQPSFDVLDADAAIRAGDVHKEEYYSQCVNRAKTPPEIIAALHGSIALREQQGEQRLDKYEAMRVLATSVNAITDADHQSSVRRYVGAEEDCFERMLNAGVVSLDKHNRCVSTIPSLREHIFASFPESRPIAPVRRDLR